MLTKELNYRQKYNSERLAREEAEKRETMYKQQLEDMKLEIDRKQASLLEAERTIRLVIYTTDCVDVVRKNNIPENYKSNWKT